MPEVRSEELAAISPDNIGVPASLASTMAMPELRSQVPLQEQRQTWIRPRYSSFDGLRGIAVFTVFLRHYAIDISHARWLTGLWFGVDLFFVLSGFLITGILFDSRGSSTFFGTFYKRRALRIFPLFYAVSAVAGLLILLHLARAQSRYILACPLYLVWGIVPFVDMSKHNPTVLLIGRYGVVSFGYLWSLSVEEHFYLIWPFIVRRIGDRRALMRFAVYGNLSTVALRTILLLTSKHFAQTGSIHGSTYTRWDTLLVGAWLALWLRGTKLTRSELRRHAMRWAVPCALVIFMGLALTLNRWPEKETNPFIASVGYTVIAFLCGAVLLLSLDESLWLSRVLRWRPLSALGVVSYGFYVLHALPGPLIHTRLQRSTLGRGLGELTIVFLLLFALSEFSFRFYEKPFLELKDRFAPSSNANLPQ